MMKVEMKITGLEDITGIRVNEEFSLYKYADDIPKELLVSCVKALYKSFLRDTAAIVEGAMVITEDFINPTLVAEMKKAHDRAKGIRDEHDE